ncbi:MAG: hypothetical protein J6D28_00720 [Bacilli bacterium]|nr:hypothetical protein [Bacilli bacterium]
MSISQKIEKYYKNRVESIKKMSNGSDKDYAIGALVADLGKRSISAVSNSLNLCREKVKSCYDKFKSGIQLKLEFRGRKSIVNKYPNILKNYRKL